MENKAINQKKLDELTLEDKMNCFFNLCKNIDPRKFPELINDKFANDEKEFYITIWTHLMQAEQMKIISKDYKDLAR